MTTTNYALNIADKLQRITEVYCIQKWSFILKIWNYKLKTKQDSGILTCLGSHDSVTDLLLENLV